MQEGIPSLGVSGETSGMKAVVAAAVSLVFLGCCSNVVFLELLIKEDPGCGNAITFFQFLFIALESGVFVTRFGYKPSHIPVTRYFTLVAFFFIVSVLNNYALGFDVPLPLHMIFRAGSLFANMVMGVMLLGKRYPLSRYISVAMITFGIAMATIASAHQLSRGEDSEEKHAPYHYIIGVCVLLAALFASARMGIFQEVLYSQYGKHPREAMFYMHALPLPGFLFIASSIWTKLFSFTASEPVLVLGVLSVPKMWVYIVGNCLTQYVCIRGVFILTTECPSLVVTLVITLRKFVSLLFSIFYFQNPFTIYHWVATAMVFVGTAMFSGILDPLLLHPQFKKIHKTAQD